MIPGWLSIYFFSGRARTFCWADQLCPDVSQDHPDPKAKHETLLVVFRQHDGQARRWIPRRGAADGGNAIHLLPVGADVLAFVFVVAGHAGQHGREIGPVGGRVGIRCVLDMFANDVQEAGHEGVQEGAGQRRQQRVSVVRVCRAIERPGQAGPYAAGDGGGQVEAGRAGGLGNVNLHAVGNRHVTGISVDDIQLVGGGFVAEQGSQELI